ncbi:hypothetical protein FKG95_25075 [Denitrobaculum tricleocarpae]|uniref:Phytase-like domain-containing protein n=1 Tax=Denitrobaculum tricleocarpae TaxID=2591009 RepID=A0A545T805_9PROT|nr:hypothetical protein FKG95_25075 [Denitrobaculum tricleocarpae]
MRFQESFRELTQTFSRPLGLLLALALCACFGTVRNVAADPVAVSSAAIPFHPTLPDRRKAGKLIWRGGLELKSQVSAFGGLSSLLVSDDLSRLTAASDDGQWFQAKLTYDSNGRLTGLSDAAMIPITGLNGQPLRDKGERDAESLTRHASGDLLVSFERNHRVWRYPADPFTNKKAPTALPTPLPLTTTFGNGGIESLVTLKDGRVLAITEAQELRGGANQVAAYLWDGKVPKSDKTWAVLRFQREGKFKPTGAARLPNGDILVLERSYTPIIGVAMRLRRIAEADIGPGKTLKGEELAVIRPPLAVDNMEGIDVKRGPDGETLVYLLSDNNFNIIQRNLLLLFELEE